MKAFKAIVWVGKFGMKDFVWWILLLREIFGFLLDGIFVAKNIWPGSNFRDVFFVPAICWPSFLYFLPNQPFFAKGVRPDVTYGPPRDVT